MTTSRFRLFRRLLRPPYRHLLWLLLLGVGLPWAIFLKVGSEIHEGEGFYGDQQALRWVHAHATPALDTANLLLTRAGGPLWMALASGLIGAGLLWRKQWRRARFFGVAVGGAMGINLLAKALLGRLRPALWVSLAPETSSSFPSGHAMGTAALALTLGLLLARSPWRGPVWGLAGLFVLGVGFSRVVPGGALPQRRAIRLDCLGGVGLERAPAVLALAAGVLGRSPAAAPSSPPPYVPPVAIYHSFL